jgi:polar amino acid transport system permease protein
VLEFGWLANPTYRGWLIEGVVATLRLAAVSSVLAILIGMIGALLLTWRQRAVDVVIHCYVETFRNTPPLLQMLFFYFTLTSVGLTTTDAAGHRVPLLGAFACATISLSLFGGALCIEAFRSGFDAIPRATLDAARSLGYGPLALFRTVQMPIAARICLPALANVITGLFKTTAEASVIAVPELMYYAGQIYTDNFRTLEVMLLVLAIYVVLVSLVAYGLKRVERLLAYPGYGV